jgi:hypothetical protein
MQQRKARKRSTFAVPLGLAIFNGLLTLPLGPVCLLVAAVTFMVVRGEERTGA